MLQYSVLAFFRGIIGLIFTFKYMIYFKLIIVRDVRRIKFYFFHKNIRVFQPPFLVQMYVHHCKKSIEHMLSNICFIFALSSKHGFIFPNAEWSWLI